ncbi:bifunctional riboflavin kinase/FAD synthetase [Paenibacillus koleovorans]|uniref:bifunctional riboflavin kinase/FAD synthetase n=1 Tax=Paenibacillus koleovorans TaxID=121608 RepID=UPI000FDA7786|nr:bifunctional riboflavin kinase/FAD synthetase [Paenibacillus koleovorans]
MQVFELCYPLSLYPGTVPEQGQVMAIGDFDGLHHGHREVIRLAVETGRQQSRPVSLMTFHPHPREVLGHDVYARCLTPLPDKLEMLEQLGIDAVYLVRFDPVFAQVTAEQFVTDMLMPLQPSTVVVGFDFAFGHQARGNADSLCEFGHGRFAVQVVRPFHMNEEKVSSTLIRRALEEGSVEHAAELLGRPYSIKGTVVHGDARGRQLGFPTANVQLDYPYVVPAKGVYAVRATVESSQYAGVMNLGTKPTFADGTPVSSFEVHLFDFNRSIYGEKMQVELVTYLRPERKFESIDALIAQIRTDAERARELLSV